MVWFWDSINTVKVAMWSGQVRGMGGGGWHLGIGGRLACRTSPCCLAAPGGSFGEVGGVRKGAAGSGDVGGDVPTGADSGAARGELGPLFKGLFCPTGFSAGPDTSNCAELGFGIVTTSGRLWKGLSMERWRAQMGGVDGGLVGDFGLGIVAV